MDHLDRLFQRLVHNIRSRNPAHLSLPFTVAELYEQIVPYRHNRRELGMETNQDYEVAVLRLLSGERGYLLGDAAMQESFRQALEARDPDPGAFREHAGAEISISPAALDHAGGARPRAAASSPGAARPGGTRSADAATAAAMAASPPAAAGDSAHAAAVGATTSAAESASAAREAADAETAAAEPEHDENTCRFCDASLPRGREVKFCPNCGQNLAVSRCPACGSEIEAGWKFCITCGREAET